MKKYSGIMVVALILVLVQVPLYTSAQEPETVVKVLPTLIEKGPENVTGQRITVAVVAENIRDLFGFDIKFKWNTTFLKYISRKVTVPVESYPAPQPPSPYGGILHTGTAGDPIKVKDLVNATAGTYHVAYSALAPAPAFNGSGTFFTMTFEIKYQQWDWQGDVTFFFDFIEVKLSDTKAKPIPHVRVKGTFIMHGIPFPYPEKPTLRIVPKLYQHAGEIPTTAKLNLSIINLHPYWDLSGLDVKIAYDTRFIKVTTVSVGPFLERFNMTFEVMKVINNAEGYVRLAYSQILPPDQRPTPEGTGVLFTIGINATAPISETMFKIVMSKLASFPHPERPEPPWSGKPWSVPIPHQVENGTLTIIHRKVHPIIVDSLQTQIVTQSNSTISPIDYRYLISHEMIRFNATGLSGFKGYCNVTIPKMLMWGTWIVMVDGQQVTPRITEDSTNTYIYFTYNFQSTRQITIISSHVIPEFSTTMMFITMLFLGLAIVSAFKLSKRRL